ncbi:hypothetical protein CALCODRAFT_485433 [Calocera cornea HHB12733]|uniref:Uncharacterized protein n=1 Tax=Calocera cornea HHB12733 TaxID=1353952 RepID=A0A165ECW7_9BASI|nr:hypothetical protein CALCODRAFT_485433 [Calocera cornea HHB12733]
MTEPEATTDSQISASILGLTFDNPPSDVGPVVSGIGAASQPVTAPGEANGDASKAEPKTEPVEKKLPEVSVEAAGSKPDEVVEETAASAKTEENGVGEEAKSPTEAAEGETAQSPKEKKKRNPGYINHDRVKTGGVRDKPSADELTERMERIRLQNAKILAKREQADKDAQAYEDTMAKEREAQKRRREVQNQINSQRQANAERKLGNRAGREWDAGKGSSQAAPNPTSPNSEGSNVERPNFDRPNFDRGRGFDRGFAPWGRVMRGGFRGAPRGGFRGRGAGPGGPTSPSAERLSEQATPAKPDPTPAEAAAQSKS